MSYIVKRNGVVLPGVVCNAIVTDRYGNTTAYFTPHQTNLVGLQVFNGAILVWSYSTSFALHDIAPASDVARSRQPRVGSVVDFAATVETCSAASPRRFTVADAALVYDTARSRVLGHPAAVDTAPAVDAAVPSRRLATDQAAAADATHATATLAPRLLADLAHASDAGTPRYRTTTDSAPTVDVTTRSQTPQARSAVDAAALFDAAAH